MEKLEIYRQVASVPQNAQKTIGAGRLKGMTDINPMWRIVKLTEVFGVCGFGWKYKITDKRMIEGADGTMCAFVDIDLFVKIGDQWSEAIPGTGGSSFISNERSGKYTSDEAFKMSLTDAISVACKALGFGADVYWAAGRSKYTSQPEQPPQQPPQPERSQQPPEPPKQPSARDRLVALLEAKGIDIRAYSAEKGLTKRTPETVFIELIKELEGGTING